jgi:hypothetical protein
VVLASERVMGLAARDRFIASSAATSLLLLRLIAGAKRQRDLCLLGRSAD